MVLVTGGTGFIGQHLLERLVETGSRVRAIVRRAVELPDGVQSSRADLVTGEGMDAALRGVDMVIHLAGVTKALRIADYYAGNEVATRNLARAIGKSGPPLVYVSSLAAIGPSLDGKPVTEDAAPHPVAHYGASKLAAERAVRQLTPEAAIVRPAVVYGPRDTDVFQLLKSISKGLVFEIAGGERFFSAIYVKDLVEGLLAVAGSSQANGRDYFLAHPEPLSWGELYAAAARVMHRKLRVMHVPAPVASMVGACAEMAARITGKPGILSRDKIAEAQCRYWTCDPTRVAAEIGFTASTPVDVGLAETLAWYKEAGWLAY